MVDEGQGKVEADSIDEGEIGANRIAFYDKIVQGRGKTKTEKEAEKETEKGKFDNKENESESFWSKSD